MMANKETLRLYLYDEVETASQRYNETVQRLLALLDGPEVQPNSEILYVTRALRDDLRTYSAAIRRLAAFSNGSRAPLSLAS